MLHYAHRMGNETRHLITKTNQLPISPIRLFFSWFAAVLFFAYVYYMIAGSIRYFRFWLAMICGPVLAVLIIIVMSVISYQRIARLRHSRTLLSTTLCFAVALGSASYRGDHNYNKNTFFHCSWNGEASYMNIDPSVDKGQTYMDAGQVYFKEYTQVAADQAIAFQSNGIYCVAPIVRQPILNQGGAQDVKANGIFKLPASGTFDFWAVGTDCCDPSGMAFKCGSDNPKARAGMRLISDAERPYYLMAVQEWTSKMGLPAMHPLFFTWVQDPLQVLDNLALSYMTLFWRDLFRYAGIAFLQSCFNMLALYGLGVP